MFAGNERAVEPRDAGGHHADPRQDARRVRDDGAGAVEQFDAEPADAQVGALCRRHVIDDRERQQRDIVLPAPGTARRGGIRGRVERVATTTMRPRPELTG